MAILCCICGKKQSGWLQDYPLSVELHEHRVCVECWGKYEKIVRAEALEQVTDEIEYIKGKVNGNKNIDKVVSAYLTTLFSSENVMKNMQEVNNSLVSQQEDRISSLLITSGFNFEGYHIMKYCDFIMEETVLGIGAFKSLFASVSNITGTESVSLHNKIEDAKNRAILELKKKALSLNANAIIGIDIDFTMFADSMIAVIANGTAVIIEKDE